MKLVTLDLNADLGESANDFEKLLPIITSANVACGGHAGGGELLKQTISEAVKNSVQVGAHPSYPDRENFGRVSMKDKFSKAELVEIIAKQIEVVVEELKTHGVRLSHVKAHGALYNDAMVDDAVAEAFIEAVKHVASVPVFGLPNSVLEKVALKHDLEFVAEGYMDRAYTKEGMLVPRSLSGAVLNHEQALTQIEQLAKTSTITAIDGLVLAVSINTLCIHADTPDASTTAQAVSDMLEENGVAISFFKKSS